MFMNLCIHIIPTFFYWKDLRKVGSRINSMITSWRFSDTGKTGNKCEFYDNILVLSSRASPGLKGKGLEDSLWVRGYLNWLPELWSVRILEVLYHLLISSLPSPLWCRNKLRKRILIVRRLLCLTSWILKALQGTRRARVSCLPVCSCD